MESQLEIKWNMNWKQGLCRDGSIFLGFPIMPYNKESCILESTSGFPLYMETTIIR